MHYTNGRFESKMVHWTHEESGRQTEPKRATERVKTKTKNQCRLGRVTRNNNKVE